MSNSAFTHIWKEYIRTGLIVLLVFLGAVVVTKEVARQNPEFQQLINNSFLSSILGANTLPDAYFKAAQINDNYHRCQNKLGFSSTITLDDIYNATQGNLAVYNNLPTKAKVDELEAPIKQMYLAGARYVYIEIQLSNSAQEDSMAKLAGEYAKLVARNHMKAVFNLGPKPGTAFVGNTDLLTRFITKMSTAATETVEFVVNAYPSASFTDAANRELSSVIKTNSDKVARAIGALNLKNAIVTPPPMKMIYNPGCPGAGSVCKSFGPETDPFWTLADMNIFRGTADFDFNVYDMLMMGFENYDQDFKDLSKGGLSKQSRMGYTHYSQDVKKWITDFNDNINNANDSQREIQVLVVDYGPGAGTVNSTNSSLLTERLAFDFGLFSDDPTIAGVVLSSNMYTFESNISGETYRKLNLSGTNCNYDLVDYNENFSENSTAPVCDVKTNVTSADLNNKAKTRVVCVEGQNLCEATIQYTVQVGLPIRFFGSNSGVGTDTQTTIPPSAKAAKQPLPIDFLNQFAGALSSSNGTYTMPWLGNAINSSRIGLGAMVRSLPQYDYMRSPSPGSYPRYAALEQVAESTTNPTFNNWTYNTSGTGKFNLRDEASVCAGKDACINKLLVSQLDDLRDYDSTKQTFPTTTTAPLCGGNVQYLNIDPQNYIYGSEQIISETTKSYTFKQLGYEILKGNLSSNNIRPTILPGGTCLHNRGARVALTYSSIKNCNLSSSEIERYINVDASKLPYVYSASDILVEESLPVSPQYDIPGAYDALAASYNLLQQTLSFQGRKMIFGQNIGWEADIQVKAYSVVSRDKKNEGEATFGITSPRKNNLLENFDHEVAVPLLETYLGDKAMNPTTSPSLVNTNSCRVGVNLATYAIGVNDEMVDKIKNAGYQQALVITNGVEGEKSAVTAALNKLCAQGITPVLRSCITGTCFFNDGVSQANYLNEVINAANQCKSVYAICGHNEPESEYLAGFVEEGKWTKSCFDKLRGNSKIKLTTPTFNATHPEIAGQLDQFISGYGASDFAKDKGTYACLSANSYTYLDGATATASMERITNDGRFAGMPLCIFETGVTGNVDQVAQNANVKQVVSELFQKYGGQLVMVLGFNWLDTNPDTAWDKFQLNEKNNSDLAQCKFTGSTDGSSFFTIPGEYITEYENYLAEGTNWRTDKHYYEWLGAIDEVNRLTDIYANISVENPELDSVIRNIPLDCSKADLEQLKAGKQVNCFAPGISNPAIPGYVEDPLGLFLCSKGYEVVGTNCSKVCLPTSPTPTATTGELGSGVCHPGNHCDALISGGKGGYTYPMCRDQIKVAGTDTFCQSLKQVNQKYGTGSDNIYNESVPVLERAKLAEAAGRSRSTTLSIFGTYMAANNGITDKLRAVEAKISQWKDGDSYNFPSGKYKFVSYGGFNARAEECLKGSPEAGLSCLSMHSFGLAFDFNGNTNPFYASTNKCGLDIPPEFVEAMESVGFRWGGRFGNERYDPMHFEYNDWCLTGEIPQENRVKSGGNTTPTEVISCPVVPVPSPENLPKQCNEFNCFSPGVENFLDSLACVTNNTAGYMRSMTTDRWVDRYGPFCDNETRRLPFAYNLFKFYDTYLPPGSAGGRSCGELPPAGPLPGDEALRCSSSPTFAMSTRHLTSEYQEYRGALVRCPIPTIQQRWTAQNSFGIARAAGLSDDQIAARIKPLAARLHATVVYNGMRLSNTPIAKVEKVLIEAYKADVNPFIILGVWGTESWFGQYKPQCNVYL